MTSRNLQDICSNTEINRSAAGLISKSLKKSMKIQMISDPSLRKIVYKKSLWRRSINKNELN